jgi:hypothetical protein
MYVEKCGTYTVEWYIMSVVMWWGLLEWGILSMAVTALKLTICTHLGKSSVQGTLLLVCFYYLIQVTAVVM